MMKVMNGCGGGGSPGRSPHGTRRFWLSPRSPRCHSPPNSVIPSICRATYDRRLLPGESEADVFSPYPVPSPRSKVSDLKSGVGMGKYTTFTGELLTQEKFFPAWLFEEDHWFVNRSLKGLTQSGLEPEIGAYRFCTNAAYSAGVAGVPTVGFGPAKETRCPHGERATWGWKTWPLLPGGMLGLLSCFGEGRLGKPRTPLRQRLPGGGGKRVVSCCPTPPSL